ncbi:hypothetical protein ACN47E_004845 [Coniothyrium glycines]
MALDRGLVADPRTLDIFRERAFGVCSKKDPNTDCTIPMHAFEWTETIPHGKEFADVKGISDLETKCRGTVRVIFAPKDVPHPCTAHGLVDLFERFGIPSAFVAESLQDVSQSFAARMSADGTQYVWFHLLCKSLKVLDGKIIQGPPNRFVKPTQTGEQESVQHSHANFEWLKPGFLLRVRPPQASSPGPNRTSTSDSDITLTATSVQAKVDLFCFGAPVAIRDRLQILKSELTCAEILNDPYQLLEIVLEEMYMVMDQVGWAIADVFGKIEEETLTMASTPGRAAKRLSRDHFTGLHNLAKHNIYLRENCEAALATLDDLRDHHKSLLGDRPNTTQLATRQAFKYRKTLFQSTQRRLGSLDARMANIIQLSFHIVTQGDSRMMQSENQSMKTIAIMTLIFMPLGTVASIFGTQFINLQEESPFRITVSQDFWLLCARALD